MGYATWADYVLEAKMVRSAKNARDFLADLETRLRPIGLKEREVLLQMKKEEHEKRGLPYDGEFYGWDYRYYDQKYTEKTLNLDENLIMEYFPVEFVVPAVLDIYQKLLGVSFVEMPDAETWHPGSFDYFHQ